MVYLVSNFKDRLFMYVFIICSMSHILRVLLRKPRVVFLDEAGSSLDDETSDSVYASIKRVFKATTVVAVVHRLRHALTADRVIVMRDARIIENGAPSTLLRDESSEFSRLIKNYTMKDKSA